jgi:hypothetical protein
MRLFLATLTMALALSSTALARPAGPEPATQQGAVTADKRAPDQVAPGPWAVASDRKIGHGLGQANEPVAATPTAVAPAVSPAPDSDGGPAAIVFVLIGVGAAMVLLLGGYFGVRYRHRVAIADDLVVE